jgi:hypothetical protein
VSRRVLPGVNPRNRWPPRTTSHTRPSSAPESAPQPKPPRPTAAVRLGAIGIAFLPAVTAELILIGGVIGEIEAIAYLWTRGTSAIVQGFGAYAPAAVIVLTVAAASGPAADLIRAACRPPPRHADHHHPHEQPARLRMPVSGHQCW